VLRHTAAMDLLHAGVDTSVIALWLGHESTEAMQIYLHEERQQSQPPVISMSSYRPW
jgi:site-specific recombinase XerD